jgi:hypothetical protein
MWYLPVETGGSQYSVSSIWGDPPIYPGQHLPGEDIVGYGRKRTNGNGNEECDICSPSRGM